MYESLFLNARWRSRRESLDQCADRARPFFRELAELHKSFGQWSKLGTIKREALADKLPPEPGNIRDLLAKGRNHYDVDNRVIEDLGYSLYLWNCLEKPDGINLRISCGCYPPPHMPFPNECFIKFSPVQGASASELAKIDKILAVAGVMVRYWDPDYLCVSTHRLDELALPERSEFTGVRPGWLTYISDKWGKVPALPEPYRLAPMGGTGQVVLIDGIEGATATDLKCIESIRQLWDRLYASGLVLKHRGERWIALPPFGTPVK